jgi:hypothetical protein
MADRCDPEILEVFGRQAGQDVGVDVVVEERLGVLLQPKLPQPAGYLDALCRGCPVHGPA